MRIRFNNMYEYLLTNELNTYFNKHICQKFGNVIKDFIWLNLEEKVLKYYYVRNGGTVFTFSEIKFDNICSLKNLIPTLINKIQEIQDYP